MRINNKILKKLPAINGIADEDHITFIKRTLLFDSFRNKLDLVTLDEAYPEPEFIEIKFNLDVEVIPSKRYEELILIEKKYNNLNLK